jgi:hypothetical protein
MIELDPRHKVTLEFEALYDTLAQPKASGKARGKRKPA